MKVKLYILFIIIAIVLLQQCAGLDSVSKITDSNLVQIYNTNCAGCHGRQLQHFKMLTTATKLTLEQLQHITQYGDSVKGMPAFGATINKAAIIKLSKYIKNYKYADNQVAAQKEAKDYSIEVVADNLEIPWGMEFLPNGGMLITEKKGRLLRRNINGDITAIKGLPPIRNAGQGGLLDVKLHPQYAQNGWVYISYSYIDSDNKSAGGTAILRAKIIGDSLTEQQEIFKAVPAVTTNHHFGCRMVFDEKGYLYFSVGERGKHFEFPQKTDNANGKIHRVYDDGTIPKDNPFVNTPNAIASIYSYGHRNPQGLAIHPQTGLVWEHEHGPKGGDEINLVKKGVNYGWPVISYGINYDGSILTKLKEKENMEQPLYYYVPSIAPSGMAFITGNIYPAWKNNLLIGSLSFHYLERLELNGTQVIHQEKMLAELDSRVRDVRIGPGGYIYVAVEGPGRILKLLPK